MQKNTVDGYFLLGHALNRSDEEAFFMLGSNTKDFHILVVGNVISDMPWLDNIEATSTEMQRYLDAQKLRIGGAANVVRVVASSGVAVGLLCINEADEMGRHNQLAQFNALLPQYDVIVLSDYPKSFLKSLTRMVMSARQLGKMVLIEPQGEDFSPFIGASILTPNVDLLRHVVGGWSDEEELGSKIQKMLVGLELGGLILNREEQGISLYSDHHVCHFPNVIINGSNSLIAAVAAMLRCGRSIPTAVSLVAENSLAWIENWAHAGFVTEEM